MNSYELVQGVLTTVPDPTYNEKVDDIAECIRLAGYSLEASSTIENGVGAEIRLYILNPFGSSASNSGKPLFYIDIMGQNTGIATMVARDFPQLIETLRHIHPLITLLGLDQVSSVVAVQSVANE